MFGASDSRTGSPFAGVLIAGAPSSPAWCSLLEAGGTAPPSTTLLWIEVFNINDKNPVPAGTYPIGASPDGKFRAVDQFIASDSSCNEAVNDSASGSISIDTVSATAVAGTFDLTFSAGEHVTGQFAGPVCSFDINKLGTNGGGCGGVDAGDQ